MNKSIGLEIKKVNNLIIRYLIEKTKEITNIPLTPVQIMIIRFLNNSVNKNIYQKDIEDFVQMRKSTISGVLDTMEKNNIISRINSKNDLRSKRIILTDFGKELSIKLKIQKEEFDNLLKNNINDEELNIFYNVIDKIILNLKGEKHV